MVRARTGTARSGEELLERVATFLAEAGIRHAATGLAGAWLLAPFAEHGVNLTAIHARPLAGTPWEYVFFLDVEGHPSEARVAAACEAAAEVANSYRVLGAFPRAIPARRSGEGEA